MTTAVDYYFFFLLNLIICKVHALHLQLAVTVFSEIRFDFCVTKREEERKKISSLSDGTLVHFSFKFLPLACIPIFSEIDIASLISPCTLKFGKFSTFQLGELGNKHSNMEFRE